MRYTLFFLGLIFSVLLAATPIAAATDLQDLIDLPVEVHDKIMEKLEDSKEYTEEQLETITRCMKKPGVKRIINCLSDDGLEDSLEIGYIIRDEMSNLRDKVCGGGFLEEDRCKKLQKDVADVGLQVKDFGNRLKEKWSNAITGGKAFLEKRYELTRLKKKICDKINQEGCWSWLNERLDIRCKPSNLGNDPEKLKQCRIDVAQDVWKRVEARN